MSRVLLCFADAHFTHRKNIPRVLFLFNLAVSLWFGDNQVSSSLLAAYLFVFGGQESNWNEP